jgi:hypothetical protein
MSKLTVSHDKYPLLVFDSDDWKEERDYYSEITAEIMKFIKENEYENILVQNIAYSFGGTESSPIIMVNKETNESLVRDILIDLTPDYDE